MKNDTGVTFSINTNNKLKILGMTINSKLTWDDHIEVACKRSNQRLHILRTLKPHISQIELHQVHIALIRSIFDYCSPVYVKLPNKLCKRVKKVEKRAHRLIYGEDASCSCILDGMISRREELSVRLFFKILHDKHHLLHNKLPHILPHNTRLSNFTCRTNKRLHSYFPYTTQLINTKTFTLPTNSV